VDTLTRRPYGKDPWGNDYAYLNPGLHGEIDLISFGRDGQPGGEGPDCGHWKLDAVAALPSLPAAERGFTLLELLVVIVLIGVLSSVISLSATPDPRQALTDQAQRLGLLLTLASDEARIRQQPISWEGDLTGFRFVSEAGGQRQL